LTTQGENQRREAYNAVISKYSKNLFDFGIRFCQDEEVVKDCIQQLFLELWNKNFDMARRDTLKAYLLKAIRNRVNREKEKWSKNQSLDQEYDFLLEFDIENKMIAEATDFELADKVKKALNALPPRQREIIYLRFYEGLDMKQVSNVMDLNLQSAHNLLQKAYQKIRGDWQLFLLIISLLHTKNILN